MFTVTGNSAMPVSFAVDSTELKQNNRGNGYAKNGRSGGDLSISTFWQT